MYVCTWLGLYFKFMKYILMYVCCATVVYVYIGKILEKPVFVLHLFVLILERLEFVLKHEKDWF